MTADKLADAILNKCDIYYGEALVSKEAIIEKYLAFFADSLVSKERTVNFALHTGSICFDVISVVAVALGCLSYNLSTNEDIISSLQIDDMVMYKGQRHRWKGIEKMYGNLCMIIEQDGKGRNGKSRVYLPVENHKHMIRPYYGESRVTDGRGVRKKKSNREDFLAFAFDVDVADIPTQIDVAIVIVAERSTFGEICKQVKLPHIKAISLIDKVRVVNALIGFSRIQPAMTSDDNGFVSAKEPDTKWYPAYEVRGEGIFIEFEQNDIDTWVAANPAVVERAARLNNSYATSYIGKNHPRTISPKFLMLHTLSHLLISQLSFECGYSIASLSERLYCSEAEDGKNMAGIFIYTASGDAEGTLGGLVRQGRPDAFPRILKKAVANAKTCSNDPVCIMSRGQGRDSLNLAACHACGLLPETCCEERNAFLDRGVIVGTYENPEIGFWNDIE